MQPDWSDSPLRVITFDESEVMYDSWWPHNSSWGFTSLKGKFTYYRVPYRLLLDRSRYVRTEPLSRSEHEAHRPDLPLRFGVSAELNWPTASEVAAFSQLVSTLPESAPLTSSQLYLCPFGPKGAARKATLVESARVGRFPIADLIVQSAILQAPFLGNHRPTRGIGIFRSGIQNRIPSYYLWGSRSRADAAE